MRADVFIICVAIGSFLGVMTANWKLADEQTSYTPSEIKAVNQFVASLDQPVTFHQRQADALASIYGLGGEDDGRPLEILK